MSVAFPSACGSSVRDFALPRILGYFSGSTGELRVFAVSRRVLIVSVVSAVVSVSLQVPSTSLCHLDVFDQLPGPSVTSHVPSTRLHTCTITATHCHTHWCSKPPRHLPGLSSPPGSSSSTVVGFGGSSHTWSFCIATVSWIILIMPPIPDY